MDNPQTVRDRRLDPEVNRWPRLPPLHDLASKSERLAPVWTKFSGTTVHFDSANSSASRTGLLLRPSFANPNTCSII